MEMLKVNSAMYVEGQNKGFRQFWETQDIEGNHYFQIEAKEDLDWLGINYEIKQVEIITPPPHGNP